MKKFKFFILGYVSDIKRTKWEDKSTIMKHFNVVLFVMVFFALFFVLGDMLITQLFQLLGVNI